jgi:hypothetical protein
MIGTNTYNKKLHITIGTVPKNPIEKSISLTNIHYRSLFWFVSGSSTKYVWIKKSFMGLPS